MDHKLGQKYLQILILLQKSLTNLFGLKKYENIMQKHCNYSKITHFIIYQV